MTSTPTDERNAARISEVFELATIQLVTDLGLSSAAAAAALLTEAVKNLTHNEISEALGSMRGDGFGRLDGTVEFIQVPK